MNSSETLISEKGLIRLKSLMSVFFALLAMGFYSSLETQSDLPFHIFVSIMLLFCIFAVYAFSSLVPPAKFNTVEIFKYRIPPKARTYFKRRKNGFVYILKEINGSHYKIGRTKNPYDRLKTFGVLLPYEIEYDILIETNDMYGLERALHQHFSERRVNGEWFRLTLNDIDWIRSELGDLL